MKILNEKAFRVALRALCRAAKFSGWTFEQFIEAAEQEWERA